MISRLFALMFVATCSGCTLIENGATNLVAYPAGWIEERREDKRNAKLAEQVWCGYAETPGGDDYRDGFMSGFSDYMKEGGNGEPPPLPPKRYWTVAYQNAAGDQVVKEWNEGFREGARKAKEWGFRNYVTLGVHPGATRQEHHDPSFKLNDPNPPPMGHVNRAETSNGPPAPVFGLTPAGSYVKETSAPVPNAKLGIAVAELPEEILPQPRVEAPVVVRPGMPEIVLPAIGGSRLGTPELQEQE